MENNLSVHIGCTIFPNMLQLSVEILCRWGSHFMTLFPFFSFMNPLCPPVQLVYLCQNEPKLFQTCNPSEKIFYYLINHKIWRDPPNGAPVSRLAKNYYSYFHERHVSLRHVNCDARWAWHAHWFCTCDFHKLMIYGAMQPCIGAAILSMQ
jgi:hypothetical protein